MGSDGKRKYVPIRKDDESKDCVFWFFSPLVYTPTKPCTSKKCLLPLIHPLDTTCQYRPILAIGLMLIELLKRLFLPGATCVVHAQGKDKSDKCDPTRKLVRACDLPIYAEDRQCVKCASTTPPEKESLLEETVKCAREEVWFLMDQARIIRREFECCIRQMRSQSEEMLNYLREESNVAPRYGAIAVGGLSGYILALRRGFLRKLLYTSVGAGGMAALCYPREAKEYSQESFKAIKKYFIIGYHFLNGVSRDLTGYQLPPLPNGHLVISDSAHAGPEGVPSSAHILPPTATPTHIPLPHEDPHEINKNHHQSREQVQLPSEEKLK